MDEKASGGGRPVVCGGWAWHALFLALGSKGWFTDMLVAAAASSMQALVGRLIVLTLLVLKVWNSSLSALILLSFRTCLFSLPACSSQSEQLWWR